LVCGATAFATLCKSNFKRNFPGAGRVPSAGHLHSLTFTPSRRFPFYAALNPAQSSKPFNRLE
jgi:hypothetical protein